jgi:hypothetical protein
MTLTTNNNTNKKFNINSYRKLIINLWNKILKIKLKNSKTNLRNRIKLKILKNKLNHEFETHCLLGRLRVEGEVQQQMEEAWGVKGEAAIPGITLTQIGIWFNIFFNFNLFCFLFVF